MCSVSMSPPNQGHTALMDGDSERELLTLKEVAQWLDCSDKTIRRFVNRHPPVLASTRIGNCGPGREGKIMVYRWSVMAYLESRQRLPPPQPSYKPLQQRRMHESDLDRLRSQLLDRSIMGRLERS